MMDHGRFAYSPITRRPPLRWPNGAHVALWVIPNIEHFRFDMPLPQEASSTVPDVMAYTRRDYGNRIGVFRIMDALDRFRIRATVALNAEVCDFEPEIIEEGEARNWEWMGHGLTNSFRLTALAEGQERQFIHDVLGRIEKATGRRPRGWLGSGLAETADTPDLLREAGAEYVGDWVNDDQPYPMQTSHGVLYSMPYGGEINDRRMVSGPEFGRMMRDQFDRLYQEGATSGRVMGITLHPWISGVPHRIKYLEEALDHICQHEHVWRATGSEIVEAYRQQEVPS